MSIDRSPVLPTTIARQLRSSILGDADSPGSMVTESAVALRFDVARPTARLAIDKLVAEGLLRREAHHAARVPELGRDDIVDLFGNRALIESAATAALAKSRTLPPLALAAHHALIATDDFTTHDMAFHRSLVEGQPSLRLVRMYSTLAGEIELCIGQVQAARLLSAREVAIQHQAILDAIVAGDAQRASSRTRDHVMAARDRILFRLEDRTLGGPDQ